MAFPKSLGYLPVLLLLLLLLLVLLGCRPAAAQRKVDVFPRTFPDSARLWNAGPGRSQASIPLHLTRPASTAQRRPGGWPYGRYTTIGVVSGALLFGAGMSLSCDTDCGWSFPIGALFGGSVGYVVGCVIDSAVVNWEEPVPGCPG